jgi:uncharacterized protein
MSSLRRLTKWRRPEAYLAVVLLLPVLMVADSMRRPNDQLLTKMYIHAVHGYQKFGRPITTKAIRCRFRPTCSEYSIEAVERFGITRGVMLTIRRISSCRTNVPLGTLDPVPSR